MRSTATLRLAWREIRGNPAFATSFALGIAVGLAGLLTIDAFQDSVARAVALRSKALLTADLAVSARRDLSPAEERIVRDVVGSAEESRVVEFFTMAAVGGRSRLVQVKAIDDRYPFYGKLELQSALGRKMRPDGGAWASPELPAQLGVRVGERVKLGDATFRLDDVVVRDPAGVASFLALAPKIYIHWERLADTKLVREGASISYTRLYRLAPGARTAEALARELDRKLDDPAIRVQLPADASEQVARAATYLGDYLGLVALVGFFLATVGAAYLFRAHVTRRAPEIAVLRALGVTAGRAVGVYALAVLLLSVAATVPALLTACLLLPAVTAMLGKFLPFEIAPSLSATSVATAFSLSILGSFVLCLPVLWRITAVRPASLLHESVVDVPRSGGNGLAWLPATVFFPLLAIFLAHSIRVGLAFSGGFLVAAALVAFLGNGTVRLLERFIEGRDWRVRLPVRRLARSPVATASAFLAIGLATFLVGLLAHVEAGLRAELAAPETSGLPAFFLFDVQEDQRDGVLQLLAARGAAVVNVSPLVRARLLSVNGKPFEKDDGDRKSITREEELERRFRNRGLNLTYRDRLTESEEIVAGEDFSSETGARKVSVERDFAKRLGLALGDRLVFDVQGVEVEATIANLRRIRWTSFLPNFFLQFAPGVLDDAPKTFLVAVSRLDVEAKQDVQSALVDRFANVSILDVAQVVERILEILGQMHWAMRLMALLVLLVGLAVLFAIVRERAESQTREVALLKAVGAPFSAIGTAQALDGAFLGLAAAFFGSVLAVGAAAVLAYVVFDQRFTVRFDVALGSVFFVAGLSAAASWLATRRSLKTSVRVLLG